MFLNQNKIDKNYKKGVVWGQDKPNKYVIKLASLLNKGSKILDLGCGEGRNTIFLAQEGFDLTAIDISKVAVDQMNHKLKQLGFNVEGSVCSIQDYDFNSKYDAIISTTVIHLLSKEDQIKCIENMQINTKHNGFNLITVFTKKDHGFLEYPELSFLNLDEFVPFYCNGNWTILINEEYIKHETHGVPHDHNIAIILAQKNN